LQVELRGGAEVPRELTLKGLTSGSTYAPITPLRAAEAPWQLRSEGVESALLKCQAKAEGLSLTTSCAFTKTHLGWLSARKPLKQKKGNSQNNF